VVSTSIFAFSPRGCSSIAIEDSSQGVPGELGMLGEPGVLVVPGVLGEPGVPGVQGHR